MSNLDTAPAIAVCGGRSGVAAEPVRQLFAGRTVTLGAGTGVRRLLPNLGRRLVGPWCFVDHYGPDEIAAQPGMRVPPHPHLGLQTVSWLLDGEVLHRDSLGSEQLVRAGDLGLMTAGRAIAHSEQSPDEHSPVLHGAQLWIALPDAHRDVEPAFEHHTGLPVLDDAGLRATVLMGELGGAVAPGTTYSPVVGADLAVRAGVERRLPLEPDFDHAVLTAAGVAEVDGVVLAPGSLLYLGCGRRDLTVRATTDSRMLLLGGEPFAEKIVMWWNFVARTTEEVVAARQAWVDGSRFGTVHGYDGDPLAPPPVPAGRLRPGGAVR